MCRPGRGLKPVETAIHLIRGAILKISRDLGGGVGDRLCPGALSDTSVSALEVLLKFYKPAEFKL